MPAEIDEIQRKMTQLEIERVALKKESDKASKERLSRLEADLSNFKADILQKKTHWQSEKDSIQTIREIKEKQEQLGIEAQKFEREGDLAKVAEIRYGLAADLEKQLEEARQKLSQLQENKKMLKEEVEEDDIAEVISRWTGIPINKMLEGEREKLVQILDDGRMTDGHGRTVDFKNTLIIMTSNVGSQHIQALSQENRSEMEARVTAALRASFKPEFLNRIDDTILFHNLTSDELTKIVGIQMERLETRLAEQNIRLNLARQAIGYLARKGYDPTYGARPLKRIIQKHIENPLSMKILKGEILPGSKVSVDVTDDSLVFQVLE